VFNKKPILVASSITALLLLIALAMAWLNGVNGLKQLRAELEAKGERLSWQQIAPKPPLGVSNGAFDLLPAINSMPRAPRYLFDQQFTPSGALIPKTALGTLPVEIIDRSAGSGREWISNMWDRVDPLIASHRSDWLNAERAATNQVIDFEHNWAKGFNVLLPHLAKLKHFCAWNEMAVVVDLRNRDYDSALALQTNMFAVLHKFQEPTLISQLVRIACFGIALKGTWETLQFDGFDDAQLATLQASVGSFRFADEMLQAFEMERWMLISYWEDSMNDPTGVGSFAFSGTHSRSEKLRGQLWRIAVAHRDLAHYLTIYQPQMEGARNAFTKKSDLSFASTILTRKPPDTPAIYLLSLVGMSHLGKSITKAMRAETQRELAVTAIALKRHFQKHGEYPKDLGGLVPDFLAALPIDWMDGNPLRYERIAPSKFRLWSVGSDHKDDGGNPSPKLKPGRTRYWTDGIDFVWPARATPAEIETFTNQRLKDWRKATAP
jgi:hypothetical protein